MATAVSYFICELQSVVHFQLLNPKNGWIIKIDTQDNRKLLYSKLSSHCISSAWDAEGTKWSVIMSQSCLATCTAVLLEFN